MAAYVTSTLLIFIGALGSFLLLLRAGRELVNELKRPTKTKNKEDDNYINWWNKENEDEIFRTIIEDVSFLLKLEKIVLEAKKDFDAQGGKLYLKEDEQIIKLVSLVGISSPVLEVGEKLKIGKNEEGEGMAGMVMKSQKPLVVKDYSSWPWHIERLGGLFSAVIEVPIVYNDVSVGVLSVFDNNSKQIFSEKDVPKLSEYANRIEKEISAEILNQKEIQLKYEANLLKDSYEYISSASTWEEVTSRILLSLDKLVPYYRATLQKIRGDGREIISYHKLTADQICDDLVGPISKSRLIELIVELRKPYVIPFTDENELWEKKDSTKEVKSWIGLPLVFEDKVIGLITLDHNMPGYYEGIREELLSLFGKYAAIALKTQEKGNRQALANKVIRKIAMKSSADDMFSELAEQIGKNLNAPRCKLFMPKYTHEGKVVLRPVKTYDITTERTEQRSFFDSEGIAWWVFNNGVSVLLKNAPEDKRFSHPRNLSSYVSKSMIVVPIKVNEIPIGVISVDHHHIGWFEGDDQKFVETIVANIGLSIERTRSLEHLLSLGHKIFNSDLQVALNTIVRGAIELTRGQSSAIYLTSNKFRKNSHPLIYKYPKNLDVPSPRLNEGLTYSTFKSGKEIVISDVSISSLANPGLKERGIISVICIPLIANSDEIGALFVYVYGDEPYKFTDREKTLLKILVEQAIYMIITKSKDLKENVVAKSSSRIKDEVYYGFEKMEKSIIDEIELTQS